MNGECKNDAKRLALWQWSSVVYHRDNYYLRHCCRVGYGLQFESHSERLNQASGFVTITQLLLYGTILVYRKGSILFRR